MQSGYQTSWVCFISELLCCWWVKQKPYFDRSCPRSQNQSCTEGSGGLEVIAVDEANYYGGLLTAGTQNSSPGSLPETQWLEAPGRWEEEVPVVPV